MNDTKWVARGLKPKQPEGRGKNMNVVTQVLREFKIALGMKVQTPDYMTQVNCPHMIVREFSHYDMCIECGDIVRKGK